MLGGFGPGVGGEEFAVQPPLPHQDGNGGGADQGGDGPHAPLEQDDGGLLLGVAAGEIEFLLQGARELGNDLAELQLLFRHSALPVSVKDRNGLDGVAMSRREPGSQSLRGRNVRELDALAGQLLQMRLIRLRFLDPPQLGIGQPAVRIGELGEFVRAEAREINTLATRNQPLRRAEHLLDRLTLMNVVAHFVRVLANRKNPSKGREGAPGHVFILDPEAGGREDLQRADGAERQAGLATPEFHVREHSQGAFRVTDVRQRVGPPRFEKFQQPDRIRVGGRNLRARLVHEHYGVMRAPACSKTRSHLRHTEYANHPVSIFAEFLLNIANTGIVIS